MSIFDLVSSEEQTPSPEGQAPRIQKNEALRLLSAAQTEIKRRSWIKDPALWVEERLSEHLWSLQKRTLYALRDHRKVAVKSCHAVSKSHTASRAVAWWLDIHPPGQAFVVTSAPTAAQVRTILWREIGRAYTAGALRGRVNQVEWIMEVNGKEEQVAIGRKPDEYDPTAFQGIHAPRVLVIFDEACGINGPLWEAGDSLCANDLSKFLAIGNPDDPTTEFYEICKPGSGWHVLSISAFESPNFTGEDLPESVKQQLIGRMYVEEKRAKWAPSWHWDAEHKVVLPPEGVVPSKVQETANPFWFSKVLGEFPENANEGGLIPLSWVRAAQLRTLAPVGSNEIGADVGGGGDESTLCHAHGPVARIIASNHNPDTMETCGLIIAERKARGCKRAKVDSIGIGRGVADRAAELKEPVIAVNVSEKPYGEDADDYLNLRAQAAWQLRTRFEKGEIDIDPADEDLAAELVTIRYKRTSAGKIQLESKDEYKRRTKGVSPNRFDALMLAYLEPPLNGPMAVVW